MTRLRVAATVATARTRRPDSSRARCASRAVAPVVRTSSQSSRDTGPGAARECRASGCAHRHRATQVGRTLAGRQAGLVVHLTPLLEDLVDADAVSAPPQLSCCRARHPEHGVVPAGADNSCAGRHRDENGEHCSGRARPGHWRRGHDRGAGPARRCRAPCAPGSSRAAARRTPRLRSRQPARPGTGSGARGVRARAGCPRSHGTGTGPASRTPRTRRRAPGPARRRSHRHHRPAVPGRGTRLRWLWIATADTGLGRREGQRAYAAASILSVVRGQLPLLLRV